MSDADKVPGKATTPSREHDAEDIAKRDLRAYRPGKGTLVTGVQHGAVCDRDPDADGCSLDGMARMRVIAELNSRIQFAERECGDAIRVVQFQTMLKREAELPWVFSMLLDIVTGHISVMVGGAIKSLRAGKLARIDELALEAGMAGTYDGGNPKFEAMLNALTDRRIDSVMKSVHRTSRKLAESKWKDNRNADDVAAKDRKVDYLEQLRTEMMLGFEAFRMQAPLGANDAELFALMDSFENSRHVSPLYQASMRGKLDRFEKLGLEKVGRRFAISEPDHPVPAHPIERDLRLVWVVTRGKPEDRYLAFEQSDGIRGEGLPQNRKAPSSFGAENPYPGSGPTLSGRAVPDEFVSIALERHRSVWGGEPTEVVIDRPVPKMSLGAPAAPPLTLPPNFDLTKVFDQPAPAAPDPKDPIL